MKFDISLIKMKRDQGFFSGVYKEATTADVVYVVEDEFLIYLGYAGNDGTFDHYEFYSPKYGIIHNGFSSWYVQDNTFGIAK